MTSTFTPLASSYDAVGNYDNLRRLVMHGTRAALVIALPIEAALFFRGHTFIRLWMGDQYAVQSGTVMRILLLSVLFASANTTSVGIVFGMAKHKRIAFWAIGEAAGQPDPERHPGAPDGNLWRGLGLGHSQRFLRTDSVAGLRFQAAGDSGQDLSVADLDSHRMAAVPFALACVAAERFWHGTNLFVFFVQIAVLLPLVPLSPGADVSRRGWHSNAAVEGTTQGGESLRQQEYEPSTTYGRLRTRFSLAVWPRRSERKSVFRIRVGSRLKSQSRL